MTRPDAHVLARLLALALVAPAAAAQTHDPARPDPLEPAPGGFTELRRLMPFRAWTAGLELVDWDGDGDLDALVGTSPPVWALPSHVPRVLLLLNGGRGVFGVAQDTPTFTGERAFAVADFDGDGDPDALTGGVGTFPIYLSNTGRGFEARISGLVSSPFSTDMAAADLDGDGDADALAATSGGLVLLRGHGDGTFGPSAELQGSPATRHQVELADLDGNGTLDAVATSGFLDDLHVYFNDGSGTFTQATVAGTFSVGLAVGDVDGDGDVDLVVDRDSPCLLTNDGTGAFTVSPLQPPTNPPLDLLLADPDADGDLDLVLGTGLYRNLGGGFFHEPGEPLRAAVSRLAAGDLDGDQDLDLVLVGVTSPLPQSSERVLLGDGAGRFADTTPLEPTGVGGYVGLADVDGDGDLDGLTTRDDGSGLVWRVLENDGAGRLAPGPQTTSVPVGGGEPVIGDWNADGAPDVYLVGPHSILLNEGTGDFEVRGAGCLPTVFHVHDAVAEDFDGDGHLDLFLARASQPAGYLGLISSPAPDALLLGDGTGCFTDASAALPARSDTTQGAAAGDVNGDGHVDVLTAAGALYLGDGAGGFTDGTAGVPPHPSNYPAQDVALGDLDGDGDLDAWRSTLYGSQVLTNDGSGAFTAVLAPYPAWGRRVSLFDADGDGDLDALEGVFYRPLTNSPWTEYLQVFTNDGTGTFTSSRFPSTAESEFAVGDVDGDGDPDVLQSDRVFSNRERSLAWRAWPTLGRPLALELLGPSGSPWHLIGTDTRLPRPFQTRYGPLLVNLRTAFLRTAGRLDPNGRAVFRVDVPADPALLGRTVFWQARVGEPGRFTAMEKTTLSAF